MAVVHISEEEAVSDFSRVMARFRAGDEIVIEAPDMIALMTPMKPVGNESPRLASDVLRDLSLDASNALLPEGFADFVDAFVAQQKDVLAVEPWESF